jgi:hypothetical protein
MSAAREAKPSEGPKGPSRTIARRPTRGNRARQQNRNKADA